MNAVQQQLDMFLKKQNKKEILLAQINLILKHLKM